MNERQLRRFVGVAAITLVTALGSQQPVSAQSDCGSEVGCQDPGAAEPLAGAPTVPATVATVPTTASTVATVPTTPTTGQTGASTSTAQVSPATVGPGQTVSIRGGSFAPNQTLQMLLSTSPPASLGTTRSDATGSYSATATIPATTPVGTYRLTVSGPGAQGGAHESAATVTVGLAQTGMMTGVLALVGALALASGARLVIQSQWSPPVSTRNWAPTRRRWR